MNSLKLNVALGLIVSTTTLVAVTFAQQISPDGKQGAMGKDVTQEILALQSVDTTSRLAAICSLRQRKQASQAIYPLVQLIGDETPVGTCGKNGAPDDEPMPPASVVAPSSSIGKEAAKTLASIGKPAVEPVIVATRDGNAKVRTNSVWALGEIRATYAKGQEPRTIALLARLQDESVEVRRAATWALAEIKDTQSVQSLIISLDDQDTNVRKNAAWALGEMKSASAVQSLIAKLRDPQWEVRQNSAWALGEIKNRSAIEPLTATLQDEREEVRNASATALREMKSQTRY